MNVSCTGCPAKYAVPDEKVRGKKVRITCKHCGTNIVVDGTALGAAASVAPIALEAVKPPEPATAQPASAQASYLVGFADDRQEARSVSEIVQLYRNAKTDDEALVWKDGMPDWLSPFDVPELAEALRKAGVTRRNAAQALPNASDDEPTVVGRSPFDEYNSEIARAPRYEPPEQVEPVAAFRRSGAEVEPTAAPVAFTPKPAEQAAAVRPTAAARRAESRSAAVDLFGGVSRAGSEADPSLDLSFPEEPEHKLTGARNESSVLFSLDALTKSETKAAGQKNARDREQEKAASAALFGSSAPDSLMNLGGGGFQALTAPDFMKPVTAAPEPQVRTSDALEVPNNAKEKKKGAAIWLVALIAIAAAAASAFFVTQKRSVTLEKDPEAAPDTKAALAQPSTTEPAPSVAALLPASASASASTEAPSPPSPAEAAAQALTAAGTKPPTATATPATASPAAAAPVKPAAEPKKPDAPPAAPATAPTTDDGAAFDKSAAVAALGAAAANAGSCKQPDGPTGSGKVSVTFAPSGRATMTNVGGTFAGTEVGGCVARLFRAAKVPAFAGDPVTVSKSFTIE